MVRFDKRTRARLYLWLVEFTSIPTYVGIYLMFISGYGMVTRKAALVTFGILRRPNSIILHTLSPLPYLVGLLTILHAVAGLGCLIMRRVKNPKLAQILELINVLVGIFFAGQLTVLEFL